MRSHTLETVVLSLIACVPSLASAPSSSCGCGKPLPDNVEPGVSKDHTLSSTRSDSTSFDNYANIQLVLDSAPVRKYRLHLPEDYDINSQYPIILSFHGRGKDGTSQEKLSQFSNSSYGFEGIAVYPEGVPDDNGAQQWEGDPDAPKSIDDVAFTLSLLDHLQSTFCVDTSRIYAAGKSNGGGFTGLLACDATASTRIAAFVPVSGAFYVDSNDHLPPCNPGRATIPIMEFHGWNDTVIPYIGGPNNRGTTNTTDIVKYVHEWVLRDGFKVHANETSFLCSGRRKVTRYSWDDVVVHYNYTNLGHDWPSTFANPDTKTKFTCEEAEATSIILEWFKKWTL